MDRKREEADLVVATDGLYQWSPKPLWAMPIETAEAMISLWVKGKAILLYAN